MIKQLNAIMKVGVILLITTLAVQAQYKISMVAGGNPEGANASDMPLNEPSEIAYDSKGNLYIADGTNNRIRKVDVNGKITTIAGTGYENNSGDGGLAINAEMKYPSGIAIDTDDNIYISYQARIRKITASNGIITTIAGTGVLGYSDDGQLAKDVQISSPFGLVCDSEGNLLFVEAGRIRKIEKTTGILTTIAGTRTGWGFSGDGGPATSAIFKGVRQMVFDASGNLFIVDSYNNRIRKIDASTGIISTIAGTGTSGFAGDGGLASLAQFNRPTGITIDANGNLFIGDDRNARIRKIDAITGVITTIAGNGTNSSDAINGDGGLATAAQIKNGKLVFDDANNNLLFVDPYAARIRKIDMTTGIISNFAGIVDYLGYIPPGFSGDGGLASAAELNLPRAIVLDATGNIYLTDTYNHRIRKIDAVTGIITTIAGIGTEGFSGDGGLATAAQFNKPSGIALHNNGDLYITDTGNRRIRKIDAATGIISTIAGNGLGGSAGDGGPATAARLNSPIGLLLDASGNLYVSDRYEHRVRKIDANTGIISTFAGIGTFGSSGDGGLATAARVASPQGLAIDNAGNIYIAQASGSNARVRKVDVNTGIISTFAGTNKADFSGDGGLATTAQLDYPAGLTIDANGDVYIADAWNHRIRKVDANTGIITTIAGATYWTFSIFEGNAALAGLNEPNAVAIDGQGNIYVADFGNNAIRKLTPAPALELKQNNNIIANGGHYDFGDVAVGTTTNVDFTITNTGLSVLNLTSLTANGGFSIVGTPVSTLAPGASTTITIDMNVSSVRTNSGSLTINSNDVNGSTYTVNLYGVVKLGQTITFGTLPGKTFGDANFNLSATASSGLGVTYTSSNTLVATISGNTVTIVGAGTTTLTASQSGNATYNAATDVPQTLNVGKASQTITFGAIPDKTFGDGSFNLSATTSSGLPVTYINTNNGVATISGSTVTILEGGVTHIVARQTGNANYNAAPEVIQELFVKTAPQTINFNLGTNATKAVYDLPFELTATGGPSGREVTFTSSNPSVATVSENIVTIVGVGTTTITASQLGNHNYSPAPDVTQTLTVVPQLSTTLAVKQNTTTITNGGSYAYGSVPYNTVQDVNFTITNTGSNTLRLTNIATSGDFFSIVGLPDRSIAAGESDTIRVGMDTWSLASKSGTLTFSSNDPSAATFTINLSGKVRKAEQVISFGALPPRTFGDAGFDLNATTYNGLAVTYTSTSPSVATISGNRVTIVGAGTTTIVASQAGNNNYKAAQNVPQSFTVKMADQIIRFNLGADAAKVVGDPAFDLFATGGASGQQLKFTSSDESVATIDGETVTIVGAGTTVITASQAGSNDYKAATDVTQTLVVAKDPSSGQRTGQDQNSTKAKLTLYPTPTTDILYLSIQGKVSNNPANIKILDHQGRVVMQSSQIFQNGEIQLPISHLVAGHYLLQIKIDKETILRRIVKK